MTDATQAPDTARDGTAEQTRDETSDVTPHNAPGASSRAPWVIAGVAGVVFVVLLVVFYVSLRGKHSDPGQLTREEQLAMSAAATETENVTSFSRAHFDADYARALAGSTGALRKDLDSNRTKALDALVKGKFDTSSRVTHQALVGPTTSGDGYVVLVALNGFKSSAPNTAVPNNVQVTVVKKGGRFLVENFENVGIS